MIFRNLISTLCCTSLLLVTIAVYAADSSILDYFPSIIKAQSTVHPVGTWTGTGKLTYGSSGCDINAITFAVTANTRAGTYMVTSTMNGADLVCDQNTSASQTLSNVPAVLYGNKLLFSYAYFSNWTVNNVPMKMYAIYSGEIDITSNTAKFTYRINYLEAGSANPTSKSTYITVGTLTRQ